MTYSQPGSPDYAPAPATDRTNTLSIVALILGFLVPIGGVICGFIALSQIKRTGEKGHGLALAGVIVGFALIVLTIIVYGGIFAAAMSHAGAGS